MVNPAVIKVRTGIVGATGATGATGAAGAAGAAGADGADGAVGEAAFDDHGTISSGTETLDRAGNLVAHKVTAGGNFTIAITNWPASGVYGEIIIYVVNGGAHTITWPGYITWQTSDGNAPDLQVSGTDTIIVTTLDGGSTALGYAAGPDASVSVLDVENLVLTGGVTVTEKNLGTVAAGSSTLTLDMGDRPIQKYINGGAHVLNPGTVVGSALLAITNSTAAGAITTSGWTKVTGDSFTTTDAHKFMCSVSVSTVGSLLTVQAMQ
jgi:hypothetical protein